MPKYAPIPAKGWFSDDFDDLRRSMTVFERDDRPQPTGLLDELGTPLYRMPERLRTVGFVARDKQG